MNFFASYKHLGSTRTSQITSQARRREVHVTPVGRCSVAGLLLIFTTVLFAQERHYGTNPDALLFARSAFAHGYIHGYEEGFHGGDLDLQLGRDPRNPASLPAYKKWSAAYGKSHGSREYFHAGFKDGFLAGYSDAVRLQPYRAFEGLKIASEGLSAGAGKGEEFDHGFTEGYRHGRLQGASDGRDGAAFNPINPPCLGLPAEYCDGFARAFAIGYGDGFRNQAPDHEKRGVQVAAGQ